MVDHCGSRQLCRSLDIYNCHICIYLYLDVRTDGGQIIDINTKKQRSLNGALRYPSGAVQNKQSGNTVFQIGCHPFHCAGRYIVL